MILENWTVIDRDGPRWCNGETGEERRELRAVTYSLGTRLDGRPTRGSASARRRQSPSRDAARA